MKKDIYKPFFDKNTNTLDFIRYNTIGKNKKEYFDYTASGLAFRQVENRIRDVLETYGNTHSKESSNADITSQYYEEAINSLKKSLAVDESFAIIPTGCGSTAAIKKFQELLGVYIPPATKKRYKISIPKEKLPLVIVGPYEHHSNEISYREALCEVKRVGLTKDGLIDLEELENILKQNFHREIIGSFCIASNVTGIITCYKDISALLRKYKATVCFDSAASSPYMNVDCNYYDALFLSPHKLLGGPGSCGLLIIKKELVDTSLSPTFAGGGTVSYVNSKIQEYEKDISIRETAGTPGILQFIKSALAYQLRNEIGFEFIQKQKEMLLSYLLKELEKIPNITIYGNKISKNIGIISFNIKDINPYEICRKLSSKANIQTRAGCSCAGPYGHDLLGFTSKEQIQQKPGWLRISVHYSQTIEDIDNLINSLKESI
ncbi:aminotransferase class V-fold PLP-dependent enzyme [Halarcobacter anaerophilus]|uniref:Aminotransferase n=1 Tax=Halarcobacter anaerophilus TaxID=877500 RepID=A0A4Q0XVK3_9BACT|nr:aminotransferase class V-fold PLP-dependent enzyme [Halarcobacter anaerophilus]QDF30375.1 cysteine sulfinate desulfinase [Halarcobacter anaerophilus]RXJ61536.1 aminotransferase [Halarcobacter anaerophilus]